MVGNLERLQRRLGHDVIILTSNCSDIVDADYVTKFGFRDEWASVDNVSAKRVVSLFALFYSSTMLLLRKRPDVIHSHSLDMGIVVSLPARVLRIPVLHTCHGVILDDELYSPAKKWFEILLLKYGWFTRLTVLSSDKVRELSASGITNAVFVPNGVDLDFWNPDAQGGQSGVFTFLVVGRLEDHKGINFLLDAAARLRSRAGAFRVVIAGDGTKKSRLLELAQSLELTDVVNFVGPCSPERLRAFYRQSDALVVSSVWEGFPLTILEAWAVKLPVISTAVGSIGSLCSDGSDALLVQARRPDLLAKAMLRMMENTQLRESLAHSGYEKVRASYDMKYVSQLFLNEYRSILNEGSVC